MNKVHRCVTLPREIRRPEHAIRKALIKYGKATWTQLLQETKLSKGALSKYLNMLIKSGQVFQEVDSSARPPRSMYSLTYPSMEETKQTYGEVTLEAHEAQQLVLVNFSMQNGYSISNLKNRKSAKTLLEEYLTFDLDILAANIPIFIGLAYAYSLGYKDTKANPQKQYDFFIKYLKNHYVKEFIEPAIEALAYSAFLNRDVALGTFKEPKQLGLYPEYGSKRGMKIVSENNAFIDHMTELYESQKGIV
jgi:hypothetical protein